MGALALAGMLVCANAQAWWQGEWSFRKPLAVDTTPQAGNVAEGVGRMPVLVRLHTGNFSFDGVQEQGNDLRFVAADDKTPLNHQIESFDPLLGMALIWVDLPQVAGGQRQDFWMYYGNDKAPAVSEGQRVFDPDYGLVYHFDAAGPPRDTTAYGNNAQTAPSSVVDGVVGKAAQLGGAPILVAASPSLAISAGGAFTFSALVRPGQSAGAQLVYARREGAQSLLIGVDGGTPFVEVDGQRAVVQTPLTAAQWQHLAVTAASGTITLYVNGRAGATLGAALPALNAVTALGGDVPGAAAPAGETEDAPPAAGDTDDAPASAEAEPAAAVFLPFSGAIDEVRISKVARPPALLLADAISQAAESQLIAYGPDEKASGLGFGTFGFIVKSVPWDAWIIIAILAVMALHSWWVIYSKNRHVGRVIDANEAFNEQFQQIGTRLEALADDGALARRLQDSSLWRLYQIAIAELRARRIEGDEVGPVDAATIESVRVSLDAARTRENQVLSARLTGLSNAIAGGPYIGLLGTVIGIMLVFATAAMAGDVNINAVAPGMAAALLATAMGLVVAIPALFGYNHIVSRNKGVVADMRVFVDRFVARLAELHGHKA